MNLLLHAAWIVNPSSAASSETMLCQLFLAVTNNITDFCCTIAFFWNKVVLYYQGKDCCADSLGVAKDHQLIHLCSLSFQNNDSK